MKTGSREQLVFAARPESQADLSDVVAWLEPKPGKRPAVSGVLSGRVNCTLDTRAVDLGQVLPYDRVVDHRRHTGNAIGKHSLDPIRRIRLIHVGGYAACNLYCRRQLVKTFHLIGPHIRLQREAAIFGARVNWRSIATAPLDDVHRDIEGRV